MSATAIALPFAWNFVVPAFLGLMASASYLAAYGLIALGLVTVLGIALAMIGHVSGMLAVERVGQGLLALASFFLLRRGAARAARWMRRRRGTMRLSDLTEVDRGWAGDELVDLALLAGAGLPVESRKVRRGRLDDRSAAPRESWSLFTRERQGPCARFASWTDEAGNTVRVDRLVERACGPDGRRSGFELAAVANLVERVLGRPAELRCLGRGDSATIIGCERMAGDAWDPLWIAAGAGADLAADPIVRLERDLIEIGHGWDRLLLGAQERASRERPLVRFEAGRPYLDFERIALRAVTRSSVRDWARALRVAFARPTARPAPGTGIRSSLDGVARMRAIVREELVPMASCGRRVEELLALLGAGAGGEELTSAPVAWVMLPEVQLQRSIETALRGLGGEAMAARLEEADDWEDLFGSGALDDDEVGQLRDFLGRHGHRGPGERSLAGERWGDSPRRLAAAMRGATGWAGRESATPTRPGLGSWPLAFVARRLVARKLAHRDGAMRSTSALHSALVEHGREWVKKERLERPSDLLHLTLDEWRGLESGPWGGPRRSAETAKLRRIEHEARLGRSVPAVLGGPEAGDRVEGGKGSVAVEGIPCGGGRARGRVHPMESPAGELPSGKGWILVLPDANPHYARRLGPEIAGLVCERGGPLCHLAIVARELGIPAVMAALGSVAALGVGVEVELDSDLGRVEIVEP